MKMESFRAWAVVDKADYMAYDNEINDGYWEFKNLNNQISIFRTRKAARTFKEKGDMVIQVGVTQLNKRVKASPAPPSDPAE